MKFRKVIAMKQLLTFLFIAALATATIYYANYLRNNNLDNRSSASEVTGSDQCSTGDSQKRKCSLPKGKSGTQSRSCVQHMSPYERPYNTWGGWSKCK